MKVVVMGRLLGTADGWDQMDMTAFMFYGFRPEPAVEITAGDLYVDLTNGIFEVYGGESGDVIHSKEDLLPIASPLPKHEEKK